MDFERAHGDGAPLLRVDAIDWNSGEDEVGHLVGIRLCFPDHNVVLRPTPMDEIEFATGDQRELGEGEVAREISTERPWRKAIGKPVLWSWTLTNQQGYADGVQVEFAKDAGDSSTTLQFLVVGAEIRVFELVGAFVRQLTSSSDA